MKDGAKADDPFICATQCRGYCGWFGGGTVKIGQRLKVSAIAKRWKHAIRALGPERVKQLSIHKGRHTFGSHCANRNIPLPLISGWMGHESVATTNIYLHSLETDAITDLFADPHRPKERPPKQRRRRKMRIKHVKVKVVRFKKVKVDKPVFVDTDTGRQYRHRPKCVAEWIETQEDTAERLAKPALALPWLALPCPLHCRSLPFHCLPEGLATVNLCACATSQRLPSDIST